MILTYPQRLGKQENDFSKSAKHPNEISKQRMREKKRKKRKKRSRDPELLARGEKHAVNRVGSSELFTLSSDLSPPSLQKKKKKEEPTINRARSSACTPPLETGSNERKRYEERGEGNVRRN